MNSVFLLYDYNSRNIVKALIREKIYQVVGVIPISCRIPEGDTEQEDLPIYKDLKDISVPIEKIIVLNNPNIVSSVVSELIVECMKNGIAVECYYRFNNDQLSVLRSIADDCNVEFKDGTLVIPYHYSQEFSDHEIDIPVIYVSGLDERCNVFETHTCINHILSNSGYKTLNITNGVYANLFDYIPLYSLYNPREINMDTTIPDLKERIFSLAEKSEANVIVVSNTNNFINGFGNLQNYGIDNMIIRNALSIDQIIYNIPINIGRKMTLEQFRAIEKDISNETYGADVYWGIAHTYKDNYTDGRIYFLETENEEYCSCINEIKNYVQVLDPIDDKTLETIFLKHRTEDL